jgi:hypothetical protein
LSLNGEKIDYALLVTRQVLEPQETAAQVGPPGPARQRGNTMPSKTSLICTVLAVSVAASFSGSAVAGCNLRTTIAEFNIPANASVAGVAAGTSSVPADWSGPELLAITGYYLVQTIYQGSVVDERYDNWFADHNELFVDQTPPVEGNTCNGTWVQSGAREYKLLHDTWQFDSTNTIAIAYASIRDTVTLSKDGNSFSGTETFTVYDLNNNLLASYGPFELQGTRLKVDF